MSKQDLIVKKLVGYSGIRLLNDTPLHIKPGINLIVGRNGSGKSNFIRLLQSLSTDKPDVSNRIESTFFLSHSDNTINKKRGKDIGKKFGKIPVMEYSYMGKVGKVKIGIKNVPDNYGLKYLQKPGINYQNHIVTEFIGPKLDFNAFYNNDSPLKMDYYGSIHSHFFSGHNDKRHISTLVEDSAVGINQFFDRKFLEFFESDEFKQSVKSLENTINDKLHRFFGTTNKSIRFIDEYDRSLKTELFLLDDQNYIQSHDMSTGEAVLLNLVVGLATSNEIEHDILSFDEPELHMHDDMIKVFVQEILELNHKFPNQKILVASHSTGLIENIILQKDKNINLIIFDEEKNVFNSDKDIQLINALNRNGVWFSPLMLTKKPNLFIENQGSEGFQHRDFLMSFFEADHLPNIIPIGTSGNVEQIDAFTSVFEDILKTTDVKSWGIRDGDILIKQYLVQYLKGELTLEKIIKIISSYKDIYIDDKSKGGNQFYFNCWEIENLYLMDDLLSCWKNGAEVLTPETYRHILSNNKNILFKEYFNTFFKKVTYIRPNKNQTPSQQLISTRSKFHEIDKILEQTDTIELRLNEFIDKLFSDGLLNWVPGKEVKRLLERMGYEFNRFNSTNKPMELCKQIQSILDRQ